MNKSIVFAALAAVAAAHCAFAVRPEGKNDIIYNTDGCDVLYWPDGLPETPENFWNRRLRQALGTGVKTVSYCPVSAGFGRFACRFAGEPATNDVPGYVANTHNAASAFFAQGTDPLQMSIDFCRSNNLEILVSVRINDNHDVAWWAYDGYHALYPKFKHEHPECIMGSIKAKNEHLFEPIGTWSCVDFTKQAVRDRMRTFMRELVENYDVDGVEYDFDRHLMLFRSVAEGGVATDADRALLTELMRDLRTMTEAVAKKRGRPFRVLMRMPDTVAYCRECGIDLERWLKEKLLDDWIGGGYFQLAPWDEAVAVAHRYGVHFHASMDESRIEGKCREKNLPFIPGRGTEAAYAARFAQARMAGCDGIYLFNCEDDFMHRVAKLDAEKVRSSDQLYFATYLGSSDYTVNSHLKNGERHVKLPQIDPGPRSVKTVVCRSGETYSFPMWIGELDRKSGSAARRITARALTNLSEGDSLDLIVNGKTYKSASFENGLYTYDLPVDSLRCGRNDLAVTFPRRDGKHRLLDFAIEIGAAGVERIIQIEQFDNLANRTAAFNDGVTLSETRCGITCLHFKSETDGVGAHKDFFRFAGSPEELSWSLFFRFRAGRNDPREFGLKLYFGDKAKPETRLLTIRESGSFFEGAAKPSAPKAGAAGFLNDWNRAAITVNGNAATLWLYRGGKLVCEAKGTLPAKPLVGWNLVATAPKTDLSFDDVILVDGVERRYERGELTEAIEEIAKVGRGTASAQQQGGETLEAGKTASVQQQGGEALEAGKTFTADLKDKELTVLFKSPFVKDGKSATVDFALDFGAETPEKLSFGMANQNGSTCYRVYDGSNFVAKTFKIVATNSVLKMGRRAAYYAVPKLDGDSPYLMPEIAEIIAAEKVFPHPDARVYALTLRPDGKGACRVLVDGSMLKTVKMPKTALALTLSGAPAEASARVSDYAAKSAETWPLPLPKDGFKLERCRENLGTHDLECNEYLSRDFFNWMPSSCLWNVPRKQWYRAKALCRIDPTAPAAFVPVITARLTHFASGCGRTEAIVEKTIDLSKPDASVVKKGDLYEVSFDLDVAAIMDLTSMTDGLTRKVLDYLHFEFLGPVWEKNSYYMDSRRAPAEDLRSSVIVLAASLDESPVWMKVEAGRPYSLYYPGETPVSTVTLTNLTGAAATFTAEAFDEKGGTVAKTSFPVEGAIEKTIEFPKDGVYGHYRTVFTVADAKGGVVQRFTASYGLLPADDREAGYESPYYSWNFNGAHGTARTPAEWQPVYKYLGFHQTMMPNGSWETNEVFAAQKITHAQTPFIWVNPGAEEQAKARMRDYRKRFPHCKKALIFHENGGGPFPKEVYGGVTELNDWALKHQSNRVAQATCTAKCWREVDPEVELIVGNAGESYGLVAELMRGGLPKEYVDCWGEESVGLTMAPEMSTAFTPWIIKKTASIYGYTQKMNAPWEWKCRTERYERSWRGAAALNIRDGLIAHALGYTTIPFEIGTEVANSYADSIWHVQTFTRWPLAYPAENALAIATLTRVLDCAKFVRMIPTGSLTAYALEFEGKGGKYIYAIWTARGETTAKIGWEGGTKILGLVNWKPDYLHVALTGAETATDSEEVEFLDEPGYIVTDKKIASFAVARKRTFRHENAASLAKNRKIDALEKAAEVEVISAEDVRIDPGFADAPHRPGNFAVRDAVDEEKGACIEIEHLSQKESPEIMMEYCLLKLRNPKTVVKPFDTIGIWVKGNSNWGKIGFELTDAEGEKWFTSGMGGIGCYTYDWPAKLSLNYDGWAFLQVPVTDKSEVRIVGPGMNRWLWCRDATGNGKIDWPVKITAVEFSQMGRTLNLLEMEPSAPTARLGAIEVR